MATDPSPASDDEVAAGAPDAHAGATPGEPSGPEPTGGMPPVGAARRADPVAVEEDVDVIGLSILSGSHLELVPAVVRLARRDI